MLNSRVDKEMYKLRLTRLIPKKVAELLDALEDGREFADTNFINEESIYREADENRREVFEQLRYKKEEFRLFKEEHHAIIGKIMYNIPPMRWFSSVGREYQRLKRDVKLLKKEHKFWTKYSDERHNIFKLASEQREEAKKALMEYKSLIVRKAKNYKEEFKLAEEYDKLLKQFGKEKIESEYKEAIGEIDVYLTSVKDGWFENEKIKPKFNVRKVTKVIEKIRKGKKLNKNDELVMKEITRKEPKKGKTKRGVDRYENPFSKDGIDRTVMERIIKDNELDWNAEQFMILMGKMIEAESKVNKEELYNELENIEKEGINALALHASKNIKQYMDLTEEEKKELPNYDDIELCITKYNEAKEAIEREQNQQHQQQQQGQQQGD